MYEYCASILLNSKKSLIRKEDFQTNSFVCVCV
uniref:Uncharacterized protein n=1 Tax=Heterorhabditis bacteriophora TaxID=37862 RepID=A0A1I7WJU3_HETBA